MEVSETLESLRLAARKDAGLRGRLLESRDAADPLRAFCLASTEYGLPLTPYELVTYGEESYAAMRRSTNGGGENHSLLDWEDDYYELFMAELEQI